MKISKTFKKILRLIINYYFILIFFACLVFIGLVSFYKLFISRPTYIYVQVKMGQGLWWASTQKPSIWFVKNIKKGDIQTDLLGKPLAEILSLRYYPTNFPNQYDVFIIMRLKVSGSKKTGRYNFNRASLGVGAPVDFEFPSSQFSGTVTAISNKPIKEKYLHKIVYLSKPYSYSWEMNGIKIGDKFFDGEENVVEILDKFGGETVSVVSPYRSVINPDLTQTRQEITVKLKLKGKTVDDKFVFGDDQIVSIGKPLYVATDHFSFTDYIVSRIE